jgi:hypothetical protein
MERNLPSAEARTTGPTEDETTNALPSTVVFRLCPLALTLSPAGHPEATTDGSFEQAVRAITQASTRLESVRDDPEKQQRPSVRDEQPPRGLEVASTARLLHLHEIAPAWHAGETAPMRLELVHRLPHHLEQFRIRVEMQDASETLLLLDRNEETPLPPERCRAWSLRIPFTGPGSCQVTCMLLFREPVIAQRQASSVSEDVAARAGATLPAESSAGAASLRSYRQVFSFDLAEAWHLDACAVLGQVPASAKRSESKRQSFVWIVHLQNQSNEPIYLLDCQCRPAAPEFHGSEKPLQPPVAVPYIASSAEAFSPRMAMATSPRATAVTAAAPTPTTVDWSLTPIRFRSTTPLLSPGDQVRLAFTLQRRLAPQRSPAVAAHLPVQLRPAGLVIRWRTLHGIYGEQTWPLLPTQCLAERVMPLPSRLSTETTANNQLLRCRIEAQCPSPSARVQVETPVTIFYTVWFDWPEADSSKQSVEAQQGRSFRLVAEALPGTLLPIGNYSRRLHAIFPGTSCSVRFSYLPLRIGCFPIPGLRLWVSDTVTESEQTQVLEHSQRGSPSKRPFGQALLYVYG